jgi:iron uptake system EfeUOB component EfeO/EfeM
MKPILILGVEGDAKNIVDIINRVNLIKKTWNLKEYLDDNIKKLNKIFNDYKVTGKIGDIEKLLDYNYISSLGSLKKKIILKREYLRN